MQGLQDTRRRIVADRRYIPLLCWGLLFLEIEEVLLCPAGDTVKPEGRGGVRHGVVRMHGSTAAWVRSAKGLWNGVESVPECVAIICASRPPIDYCVVVKVEANGRAVEGERGDEIGLRRVPWLRTNGTKTYAEGRAQPPTA